jgi:hypothetical protein
MDGVENSLQGESLVYLQNFTKHEHVLPAFTLLLALHMRENEHNLPSTEFFYENCF